jgi:hypothetical protein
VIAPRRKSLILITATIIFMETNADGPSFNLAIPPLQQEFHARFFATQGR